MIWKPINTVPHDRTVLLKKNFAGYETPLVVVGEVFEFNGKLQHGWRGGYDDVVKIYKQLDPKWDELFDTYAELE